jgi:putative flippase GtrA
MVRPPVLATTDAAMLTDAWRDHEKFRFLVVGAWNTVFAYLAFAAVYVLLRSEIHYLLICILAHILAVTNAFICQRRFVFRSRTRWWSAFVRFNLVQLLVLGTGLAVLSLLVEVLHFTPLFGQLTVITVTVIASYLLNRAYAFRR